MSNDVNQATIKQIRRGTAAEHESFVGAEAEITMDTTNKTLRVHDGVTPGGTILAKKSDLKIIPDYCAAGTGLPTATGQWHEISGTGMLYIDAYTTDAVSWLTVILGNETNYTAFTSQVNVGARGFTMSFPVCAGQKYKLAPRGSNITACKLIAFKQ